MVGKALDGDQAADTARADEAPAPTHDLLLSNGTVVPSAGALPTFVHIGEDLLAVLAVAERLVP